MCFIDQSAVTVKGDYSKTNPRVHARILQPFQSSLLLLEDLPVPPVPLVLTGAVVLTGGSSAAYAALKHSERRTSRGGFAHPLEEQMLGPQFVEAASDQVRTVETQARSCTTRAPARPSATRPPTTPMSCQSRSKRSKKTRPSLPGLSRCVITRLTARSDWLWTGRAAA